MGTEWRDDIGARYGDFNVNKEYPLRNTTLIKWRNCPLLSSATYLRVNPGSAQALEVRYMHAVELSCKITHACVSVLEARHQRVLQRGAGHVLFVLQCGCERR
jgi:hypothetical protein